MSNKRTFEGVARFDENACAQMIGDVNIDHEFDGLADKRVRVTIETVDEKPAKAWRWVKVDWTAHCIRLRSASAPVTTKNVRAYVGRIGDGWYWRAYEGKSADECSFERGGPCEFKAEAKSAAIAAVEAYDAKQKAGG